MSIGRRTPTWSRISVLAFSMSASLGAYSQPAVILQERSDIATARTDAISTTLSAPDRLALQAASETRGQCHDTFRPKASSRGSVATGAQLSYNDDPVPSAPNSSGDWHAHPDMNANYAWQGRVRFEGALDVNSDRYFSTGDANYDEASALTKLSFSDGRDCGGLNTFLYVSNKLTDDFIPFYSSSKSRVDALTVGASGSLPFGLIDGRLQRTSMGEAGFVLSFDLSGGRQQADPSKLNSNILSLKLTLTIPVSDSWAFGIAPSLKQTWRESSSPNSLLSASNLVAKWTPPIPDAFDRKLEIDFIESFSDVHSSTGGSSTQNDVGPSLVWSWKW